MGIFQSLQGFLRSSCLQIEEIREQFLSQDNRASGYNSDAGAVLLDGSELSGFLDNQSGNLDAKQISLSHWKELPENTRRSRVGYMIDKTDTIERRFVRIQDERDVRWETTLTNTPNGKLSAAQPDGGWRAPEGARRVNREERPMKTLLWFTLFLALGLSAQADVYLYNATDERMKWEVALPNGDTKQGEIAEATQYGPEMTTIPAGEQGKVTPFRIIGESGPVELKGSYTQVVFLVKKNGALSVVPLGWTGSNGQNHRREMTLLNVTDQPVTFDIIDAKEVRKGFTLAPGEHQTYPTKNPMDGYAQGKVTVSVTGGERFDTPMTDGGAGIFYLDAYGAVKMNNLGYVTPPSGAVVK